MLRVTKIGVVLSLNAGETLPRGILSSLTMKYYPKVGAPITRRNYTIVREKPYIAVRIPRAGEAIARKHIPGLPATEVIHPGATAPFSPPGTLPDFLFENQALVVAYILEAWRGRRHASMSLNLRAGYGKTFVAAGLIACIPGRVLYVVPTCELAAQTAKDLAAAGIEGVGILENKTLTAAAAAAAADGPPEVARALIIAALPRVAIMVINSVLMARKEFTPATMFTLTIFDEVHMYCSEQRSDVFWRAQTPFMFGMSATTADRRDGFDKIFQQHLPPLVEAQEIPGFEYDASNQFKLAVRAINYHAINPQNLVHESTGKVFAHYMYEQFAADEFRNEMILAHVARLAPTHSVFVFAEERAHLERLMAAHAVARPELPAVLFYGGVEDAEREKALTTARVIFATYSYSGTGVSIPRMSAIIFASPRYANMKQIVGRILRRGSDTSVVREIVDIVDKGTCLARQWSVRKVAYDYYGATYEKISARAADMAAAAAAAKPRPDK